MASFTYSCTALSVSITVRGISSGDTVRFYVRRNPGSAVVVDEQYRSSGSSLTKTFAGLSASTGYAVNAGVSPAAVRPGSAHRHLLPPVRAAEAIPSRGPTTGIGRALSAVVQQSLFPPASGTPFATGSTRFGSMRVSLRTILPVSIADCRFLPLLSIRPGTP